MAEILLYPSELQAGGLPGVCARCGADHAVPVKTKLQVVVAENPLYMTLRTLDSWLPLCEKHKRHFYRRGTHIVVGALCMAMFLPCMALTVFAVGPFVRDTSFGWVFAIFGLVAPFIVGFVIMYLGKHGNVEAGDMTDEGVLIVNVADRFVDAVRTARKSPPSE